MQPWLKVQQKLHPKFDPAFQEELKGLLSYELLEDVDYYRLDLVNIVSIFAKQARDREDINGNVTLLHFTKKEIEENFDIDIQTLKPYLTMLVNMHIGLSNIYRVNGIKGSLDELGKCFLFGSMADYGDDYIPDATGEESVMISHGLNDIMCQLTGPLEELNQGFDLESFKDNPIALQTIMENIPRIRPISTCVTGKDNIFGFIQENMLSNCDLSDNDVFDSMTVKEQVATIFSNVISDICDLFPEDHDEDIQMGLIHVQDVLILAMTTLCYHNQDNYTALICFKHPSFIEAH